MITLTADCRCNINYTPGAKRPYVARITGRDSKMTFAREFIGADSADVDDPGLYETRDVDKKGRAEAPDYWLILPDGDDVRKVRTDKETAMKIAKAMDAGRSFDAIVDEDGELVTPRQAEQRAVAQTIDAAIGACWEVIRDLPQKEAKKVVDQLRKLVSPPKTVVPLVEEVPTGIVLDAAQDAGVHPAHLGLTPTPVATFAAGDGVECLDAHDGANFLVAGQRYRISSVQVDGADELRLCLEGMARAWEARRFRRV